MRRRILKSNHQNKLEEYLDRIAVALELIADNLEGFEIESPSEAPEPSQGHPGRPHGRAGHCGHCGREGRGRMNGKAYCHECKIENWWDE